jgi:glycosyltransferase involved in cell wall biosynthesis
MRLTDLVTPLKPLEAMAQGRLVVASDVGGHKELIRDNETGCLFKANDSDALATAVLSLLNQPQRWDKLRAAGRLYVEQERNWTKSAGYYKNIYAHLIK